MRKLTLMVAALIAVQMASSHAGQKKYISFGWEYRSLTPAMVLSNADKFKDTAIDGIGLYVNVTNSLGQRLKFVTTGEVWEKDAFRDQLEDFRRISQTPHLSESFIVGFHAPEKRFSWTDDGAWENLANSMAVLGWLTKETGLKGMNCDLEDYHHQKQYERLPGDPEWDELVKIVRKRGAQVFGAFFRENPKAKVLFYYCLTMHTDYFTTSDVRTMMRKREDLTPAFIDGILDAMPETVQFIDGDEGSYWASAERRDFHSIYVKQRSVCPQLLSPENRAKYLRLTQVSFALYYDMYVNEKGKGIWYFPPTGGSRCETFRRNLLDATRLADEYVWFWGEKNPTIHWENAEIEKRVRNRDVTWNEAIPGLTEAMLCCKDPDWGLERRLKSLKEKGELVDLCKNSSCEGEGDGVPEQYVQWHRKSDKNVKVFLDQTTGCEAVPSLSIKDGIVKAFGCACISTSAIRDVTPGEAYGVVLAAKGECNVGAVFEDAAGTVTHFTDAVRFVEERPLKDGWRQVSGMVVVPPGVSSFRVKVSIATKYGPNQFWVDDIHIYKLW